MISSVALNLALSAVMVPPDRQVVNHAHPAHYAQPTVQRFERESEDQDRGDRWAAYCKELDQLWQEYREADSTPRAWREYTKALAQAKRRYVIADPYLLPIEKLQDQQRRR